MSEEQLKELLRVVKADLGLRKKLKTANLEAVVTIAKEAGLIISAEELKRPKVEISENELEGVMTVGAKTWASCVNTVKTCK